MESLVRQPFPFASELVRARTIKIKVAEIIEGGTRQEFYADLQASLDLARRAANKASSLCFAADSELMTGGKCPKLYTYPIVSSAFPGAAVIAANICRAVETKYIQERWHVATGQRSICNYRSMPWVLLSNNSKRTIYIEDRGQYLTAKIKLLGGWWTARLAGGSNYREQIKTLRFCLANPTLKVGAKTKKGETSAVLCGVSDSKIWVDNKHVAVLGISVRLPDAEAEKTSGTLTVCTAREALIVATNAKTETPLIITGDEVKNWLAERNRKHQRLRQDQKSGASRQRLNAVLRRVGDKWKRRMDSFTHEVAARIVTHARRRKMSTIKLDFTNKSFITSFPYFELATKIKYKCEDAGIQFLDATQAVGQPDVTKPHVYFKYSPATGRVKIGKTGRTDGGRQGEKTVGFDRELTILAVDNQPKIKLTAREKRYHAMFATERIDPKGEWFEGKRVIHFLRSAGWLGNAGNLSQIAQVLPVEESPSDSPASGVSVSVPEGERKQECSQDADKSRGYTLLATTALETTNEILDVEGHLTG